MKRIISEAKKSVIPTLAQKKSKKKTAEFCVNLVKKQAAKYDQVTRVKWGGSYAKNTWLEQDTDLDIFVEFIESTPEEKFVEISQKIGFAALKEYGPYVRYSDHPYVEAEIQNTKVNVVPYYDVEPGRWKSAADRTPYHTKHMTESLTPKMREEVRLLKAFLMAAGIYGAEMAKRGFSGYICEVLILNFKSFENVLKSAASLKEGSVIGDTREKFDTPIVIVDPIDEKRNLAAAISEENIGRFILRCRAFQKNPSLQFFEQTEHQISKVDSRNVVVVRFCFTPRSPEAIWGQVNRAASSLATQLGEEGFNVLRSVSYSDEKQKAYLLFLLESVRIPAVYVKEGPEFFKEKYANKFVEKNIKKSKLMWIGKNKRILSLEERKFTSADKFLKSLLSDQTNLPKGLRNDFKNEFKVYVGFERLNESVKTATRSLVFTDEAFFHFN